MGDQVKFLRTTSSRLDELSVQDGSVIVLTDKPGIYYDVNGQRFSLSSEISTKMDKNNPTGTGSFSLNRKANTTVGNYSFAEGYYTEASGEGSHAEGHNTNAMGQASHAEGYSSNSLPDTITSDSTNEQIIAAWEEKRFSLAKNYIGNHVEGQNSLSLGQVSHAEGFCTKSTGLGSHSEGYYTEAIAYGSHAEGDSTSASGQASHVEGRSTKASGDSSHAEGSYTRASGERSHAEGDSTIASGECSHAEGSGSQATGFAAHAEGGFANSFPGDAPSIASGDYSHAEGTKTTASALASHAEGSSTTASSNYSHSEGQNTTASGIGAHAEGYKTKATGDYSHAEGGSIAEPGLPGSTASGMYSHAEGVNTIAASDYQHVQGKSNIEDADGVYAHIVGNGHYSSPSNAHTLDWDGNAWFAGEVTIGSNAKTLATEEYVDLAAATVKNDLLNGAGEAYDTLKELGDLIDANNTALDALETVATNKANASDVTSLQNLVGDTPVATQISTAVEPKMDKANPTGTGSFSLNREANTTVGDYSFAEGYNTEASGEASHAEGIGTNAYGTGAHAEGISSSASNNYTHAEGASTTASGHASHAEGCGTVAEGQYSHAEGFESYAGGNDSHAEGLSTMSSGHASHAEGGNLSDDGSTILSSRTISASDYPVIGDTDITISSSTSQGIQSHAEGTQTLAFGYSSHAEGTKTSALGDYSHAEGYMTVASGARSHAEGGLSGGSTVGPVASGFCSHAEGSNTTASGSYSHAEGQGTTASGANSHTEGSITIASGSYSHAEGRDTTASGTGSHAEGYDTLASSDYQHVQGQLNIEDTEGIYAHIVGNGSGDSKSSIRSNAHTLDWDGNAWFAGEIKIGGTGQDDTSAKTIATIDQIGEAIDSSMEKVLVEHEGQTITWDGNTDGLTNIGNYYKVSDYVPTAEQINGISKVGLYEYDEYGVVTEAYYPVTYRNNYLNDSNGYYQIRTDSTANANYVYAVRIYPENNTAGKSPGIYFYKYQTTSGPLEVTYTTTLTISASSEVSLPTNLVGYGTASVPGRYGGLYGTTTGYNIPSIFVNEHGVIKAISNTLLGPVSSKSTTSLGLVSYNQLNTGQVNSRMGTTYWLGAAGGGITVYNLSGVAIDTLTYTDTSTSSTVYNYTLRILDVQVYVYTSSTATTRTWVSVPFTANATKKSSTNYTNAVVITPPSEYFEYSKNKNMDGTTIDDDTTAYVGFKILYVSDPTITATSGH